MKKKTRNRMLALLWSLYAAFSVICGGLSLAIPAHRMFMIHFWCQASLFLWLVATVTTVILFLRFLLIS